MVDARTPESIRLFRGRGDDTLSGSTSIDGGGDPCRAYASVMTASSRECNSSVLHDCAIR